MITITVVASTLLYQFKGSTQEAELVMMPVDIESVKMIEAHGGRLGPGMLEMTYSKTFNYSDLIAVAEITSDIVTYYKPHIHTLYNAKVVRVIKGSAPPFVYIYQGYIRGRATFQNWTPLFIRTMMRC